MKKAFAAFVAEPTCEHYLAARSAALRVSRTKATSEDLARLTALSTSHQFGELMQAIDELPLTCQLSPRVHYLAWMAAEQMRDDDEAELERYLFSVCLKGILESGSGSFESPYQVLHISDEYDVLLALGCEAISQRLIKRADQEFDVVRCTDGQERWFELGSIPPVRSAPKKPRKPAKTKRLRVVK